MLIQMFFPNSIQNCVDFEEKLLCQGDHTRMNMVNLLNENFLEYFGTHFQAPVEIGTSSRVTL